MTVVMAVWVAAGGVSQAQATRTGCDQVPANIFVEPALRPVVERALRLAPTFERQCSAIAAVPDVRVTVRLQVGPLPSGARAEATINRHGRRALRAEIQIPVCRNPIEMLAHEFEHVLEQIEGVRLADQADLPGTGVRRVSAGAFETARARAAGKAAEAEVDAVRLRRRTERLRPEVSRVNARLTLP